MTTTNKIPTYNSLVDLKTFHNDLIDNKSKHGYYNLIANNRFQNKMPSDDMYPYWVDMWTNYGKVFNYSRPISTEERSALIPGNKIIFGLTYHDNTPSNTTGSLTPSNVKIGSSSAISFTEIANSTVTQSIDNKQIVTKYFESNVGSSINVDNISFTLTYSGNECVLLNSCLYQGNAVCINDLIQVDDFSQFIKYEDYTWKIRTGGSDVGGFVELTTDHANNSSGVHGVGAGEVVGTTLNQTLTNKTLSNVIINNGVSGSSVITTDISNWNSDNQVVSAKALKTKIEAIVVSADVDSHNQKYNWNSKNDFDPENQIHGIFEDEGDVVGTDKIQTLTNKTLSLNTGNKIGSTTITGINSAIATNQVEGHLPTNLSIVNYMKNLLEPSYYNCKGFSTPSRPVLTGDIIDRNKIISGTEKRNNVTLLDDISFTNKYYGDTGSNVIQANNLIFRFDKTGIYNITFSCSGVLIENNTDYQNNFETMISLGYDDGTTFRLSDTSLYNYIGKAGFNVDAVSNLGNINTNVITAICHLVINVNLENISDPNNFLYGGKLCKYIGFRLPEPTPGRGCNNYNFSISVIGTPFINYL